MQASELEKDAEKLKFLFSKAMKAVLPLYETEEVCPPRSDLIRALSAPLINTKVVIVGQDPYFNKGEANGLAFSVNRDVKIPPSLKAIFKELNRDLGTPLPLHGDLSSWHEQGVVLLNRVLSVKTGSPKSHQKLGWEEFTLEVIKLISQHMSNIVFMLWGKDAAELSSVIDHSKHLVLLAGHPSPLNRKKDFAGCSHFSKANDYLIEHNKTPINWEL